MIGIALVRHGDCPRSRGVPGLPARHEFGVRVAQGPVRREVTHVRGRIPSPMSNCDCSQERKPAGAVDDDQSIRFFAHAPTVPWAQTSASARDVAPVSGHSSDSLLTAALKSLAAGGAGSPSDNRPPEGRADRIAGDPTATCNPSCCVRRRSRKWLVNLRSTVRPPGRSRLPAAAQRTRHDRRGGGDSPRARSGRRRRPSSVEY